MKKRTCCFTGHRDIPQNKKNGIKKRLESEIENLISKGVIYFGTGGAIGFDTIAALTVIKLRAKHPQIKFILVIPCEGQSKSWQKIDKQKYEWIREQADKVVCLSDHYYRGCMHTRNRHLVDNASHCICYLNQSKGGTAYTVDYAIKKGLRVVNVSKSI